MLNPNMYALLDDPVANLLVHDHADGALGHVPHNPRAPVVELMRHALVNGTVHLDVHILPDLEIAQVYRQGNVTLVTEGAREQVSRPGAKSMASPAPRFYLVSAEEHFPSEGAASSQKQKRLNHGSIPKIARAFVCLLRRSLFLVTLLLNIATLCVDCLVFSLLFPFLGGYLTMLYNRLACPRKYSTLVTVTHFAPALCYCYNCRGPSPRAVASSRRIYMVVVF